MTKRRQGPRAGVPDWDVYYMALCFIIASKSKDPSTQHGSIVVDFKHRPMGFGFNGPAKQYIDKDIDWSSPSKYPYISHAERNAIRHCRTSGLDGLDQCAIYITGAPCSRCADLIISHGIKKTIYGPQKSECVDEDDWKITTELYEAAGTQYHLSEFKGNLNWMRDRVRWMEENLPEIF